MPTYFSNFLLISIPSPSLLMKNPLCKPSSLLLEALSVLLCYLLFGASEAKLQVGFYSQTCPNAESIVTSVVKEAALSNPRIPAILLRLHFHDCFVEGCDGSILIENGGDAEKRAFAHQGLEGFEEIDRAKGRLEAVCPGVVSCADILALAARDAIVLSKGPFYQVETGRRDGRISSRSIADAEMPDANESIQNLKSKFRKKGLSEKDLVLLSAAHTIGTTACFFMEPRLYSFNDRAHQSDPAINPKFLPELKNLCPEGGPNTKRIPLDRVSSQVFDDMILRNINDGFAVLASDARLRDDNTTKQVIDSYVGASVPAETSFAQDFAKAMVRVGRLGVKVGSQGEIRRKCMAFN